MHVHCFWFAVFIELFHSFKCWLYTKEKLRGKKKSHNNFFYLMAETVAKFGS